MPSSASEQGAEHPEKEVAKNDQGSQTYHERYDPGLCEGFYSYKPGGLCPIEVGVIIKEKYKILDKRDYDRYHTSWYARDLKSSQLVQVDIFTSDFSETAADGDAARNFRACLGKMPSEVKGCFQDILDEVWIDSANGRHLCRVLEFSGVSPGEWLKYSGEPCFSAEECRSLILTLMRGLCELHDQGLAHRAVNINSLVFVSDEAKALSEDQLRQLLEDPRGDSIEKLGPSGASDINLPKMVYIDKSNDAEFMEFDLQPRLRGFPPLQKIGELHTRIYPNFIPDVDASTYAFYVAPENIGNTPDPRVTAATDVWAAACVIVEIVTGMGLFGNWNPLLGQMQGILGDIPNYLRRKWGTRSKDVHFTLPFFRWFPRGRPLSQRIRERLRAFIEPSIPEAETDPVFSDEEHALLVDLLSKMLEYDPAKRITAREALNHPWFSVSSSNSVCSSSSDGE
ncbi:hypothetical protein FQN54_006559 [Arachnomyces sp. PD_36]|nr:hypothetical protein FQN54_006559 [Arachnomyces sp. PD_36]